MYLPSPVYHQQQQYQPNRPNKQHYQNRPKTIPLETQTGPPGHLTPLTEPVTQINQKLSCTNLVTLVPPKPMKGLLLNKYDRDVRFTYHMDSPGHDTYNYWASDIAFRV